MRLTLVLRALSKSVPKSSHTPPRIIEIIDTYSKYHPSTVNLKQFVDLAHGKKASEDRSFIFLRKELPVRLANIMQEIHLLPQSLLKTKQVSHVQRLYLQSFQEILKFEDLNPNDQEVLKNFCQSLIEIKHRHSNVVETMAKGVVELREKENYHQVHHTEQSIQYFLDRFYMNRISIRMLINQHTLLFGPKEPGSDKLLGCIDPKCDVVQVARDAFENARFLCEQYYSTSPDCNFTCLNATEKDAKITLCYVPSHLYHIMFELIKNSLRAVVEHFGEDADLPPIQIYIVKGEKDVTIKLSDQGGGVAKDKIDHFFRYMYSTAPRPSNSPEDSRTPLAGYGYGLPLSRLYARYFNGDLRLYSVEGYGLDALVYLKMYPKDASELLPVYNKTALHAYSKSIPVGDWSDSHHKFAGSKASGTAHNSGATQRNGPNNPLLPNNSTQTRNYSTFLRKDTIMDYLVEKFSLKSST